MYADRPQIIAISTVNRPVPPKAFSSVEERFRCAGARLSVAQQEKMEATLEFLAARAALSRWMEELWPGQERQETDDIA